MEATWPNTRPLAAATSSQSTTHGKTRLRDGAIRARLFALGLSGSIAICGCLAHSKPPYANDPLLLQYKPATTDSATIIAQRNHHDPVEPPAPIASRELPRDPFAHSAPSQIVPVSAESSRPLVPPPDPLPPPTPDVKQKAATPPDSMSLPTRPDSMPSLSPPASNPTTSNLAPPPSGLSPTSSLPTRPSAFLEGPDVSSQAPNPRASQTNATSPLEPPAPELKVKPSMPPSQTTSIPATKSPFVPAPAGQSAAFVDAPPPMPRGHDVPFESPPPSPKEQLAKHRSVPGDYGHDTEYRWIQGVLEKHYRSETCVRYSDPAVEDQYGGKFRLNDDRQLSDFHEGDVIGIEGEVIPTNDRDHPASPPRYLIRDVWLVRSR